MRFRALVLGLVTAPASIDVPLFEYTVRIADPARESVEVVLEGSALPARDSLALNLPREFAFVRLDEPLLEGEPEATDGEGRALAVERTSPFRWSIATDGASELRVRLTVPLTHRALPAVRARDSYEYPYLAADHGMLVTATMLPVPELPGGHALDVVSLHHPDQLPRLEECDRG